MSSKHIAIIGGGVAGYPAAIRAARMGAKVTLIEKAHLGGTCLNWGCIPTKVMLHSTEMVEKIRGGSFFGITGGEKIGIKLPDLLKRKQKIVSNLTNGVRTLLKVKKIEIVTGTACFENGKGLHILETDKRINFDIAIIASGSEPSVPSIEGIGLPEVITSKEALDLAEPPADFVIIGGGVIGVEFAQIFQRMGSRVVIIELLDKLIGQEDREVSEILYNKLKTSGISIHTNAKVTKIEADSKEGRVKVCYQTEGKMGAIIADKVLLAVGRVPYFEKLRLEKIGVEIKNHAIRVNDNMETSRKGIFAIGDCVGGLMLAHLATEQGEIAARNAMGHPCKMDYGAVPRCIYTLPQIAACGLTEEQAETVANVMVARFPLTANGKASLIGENYGMIKIIAEKRFGQILGVMIAGPSATELISVACLGMKMEMTAEELTNTIFAHPTISEVYRECAFQFGEGPIHLP